MGQHAYARNIFSEIISRLVFALVDEIISLRGRFPKWEVKGGLLGIRSYRLSKDDRLGGVDLVLAPGLYFMGGVLRVNPL